MEQRKQKEIEFYDKEAELSGKETKESGSMAGFDPFLLSCYKFLQKLIKENCHGKKVLDLGCGTGIHILNIAKISKEVVGIDLSAKSLEIARIKITEQGLANAKVLLMDAEKLDFTDNFFDVVFDGGTFSSIDLEKTLPEIIRVLKPEGALIGIETFGHNPFTNLKRLLNKKTGRRTKWAAEHIVKTKDIDILSKAFENKKICYFHLVSWMAFPFINLPGGKFMLKLFEFVDKALLFAFPFLKRYSFKIVFIFFLPQK